MTELRNEQQNAQCVLLQNKINGAFRSCLAKQNRLIEGPTLRLQWEEEENERRL